MPRQVKANENGERKVKKSSSKTDSIGETTIKKSSSKSSLVRRDSLKSTTSQAEVRRTASSKSIPAPRASSEAPPQRRDSVTSEGGGGFLAKVTCWQQRVDPDQEANIGKKRKQRPVSVSIPENVSPPRPLLAVHVQHCVGPTLE